MSEGKNMLAKKTPEIMKAIQNMESQFALVVPKCLTPERMVRVALSALGRTPKLKECTQQSLLGALMTCAELGIEPDGRRAHLIPYGKECQLIIDYKGLVELVRRSGQVQDVRAEIVCDEDAFEWRNGIVTHRIDFKKPRGKMYAAYSYVLFKDGAESFEVMTKDEIESIRNRSRAGKAGPWVTDFNEMAKKTVFRRHSKWLPLSAEFRDALEKDVDSPPGIEVSRPVYDHAATVALDEPQIPVVDVPDAEMQEPEPEVPTAKEPKAKAKEPEQQKPDPESDGLTPVEELNKAACLAELRNNEAAPFFDEVVGRHVPGDLSYTDCAVSLLREIVEDMRVEAESFGG